MLILAAVGGRVRGRRGAGFSFRRCGSLGLRVACIVSPLFLLVAEVAEEGWIPSDIGLFGPLLQHDMASCAPFDMTHPIAGCQDSRQHKCLQQGSMAVP